MAEYTIVARRWTSWNQAAEVGMDADHFEIDPSASWSPELLRHLRNASAAVAAA